MRSTALAILAFLLFATTPARAQLAGGAKPWLGVLLGAGKEPGARVEKVLEGTPAAKAGLKEGDCITTIDGAKVDGSAALISAVQERGVGQKVTLGLSRGGRPTKLVLALEARPDELELMRGRLVGKPVPKFALAAAPSGGGPALSSEGLKGKVVLVELWATWCGPCRASMPRVDAWAKKFEKQGLVVVAVSEEPAQTVARFGAKEKIAHPLYRHEGLAASLFSSVVPTWVVVDRAGVVRHVDVGGGSKLDDLERAFVPLLDQGAPPLARQGRASLPTPPLTPTGKTPTP